MLKAVLWDFGGVILTSPFEAFSSYEARVGLANGFIRGLNATNPDANAWAKFERSEVSLDTFCDLFEAEARAAGGELDAREVLLLLDGQVRPEMVEALRRCQARFKVACLTNNVLSSGPGTRAADPAIQAVMAMFDVVVESSKVGVRKPEPAFYRAACDLLDVEPSECVFLDDLGVNLKPAKELGMQTIKVVSAAQALTDLEAVVGFALR